ncbi:MAG: hypothetical protein NTY01_21620 [Verrucomicrobia bacterium]|nr:hypothetical protein [Verrucomicrobiota bacterium]
MNQPLIDFVRDALLRGVSRADIALALEKGGWSAKEIQAALDAFADTNLPVPVPRKRASSSPKEAFFFLVMFSTLYGAAFAFGAMLFDLINLTLSQPDETLRFSLKAAVVAILAGGTFLHYLRDLRRDEVAPSAATPGKASADAKIAFAGLIAAVVAVVAMGVWFAGSPMRARLLAQDRQRVQDMQTIYWRVEQYYREKGQLPATLAACDISPATFIERKKDRVTGKPYVYRAVDATHFEVGATFALASAPEESARRRYSIGGPESDGFWRHDAGLRVYRIDVARKKR